MAMQRIVHSVKTFINVQDMVVCVLIVLEIEVDLIVKVANWVSIDCLKAKANVWLVDVTQSVSDMRRDDP